jgi:uncharacterized protein (TIGR04255 family)
MAEKRHYPRPPITEAVLELRFDEALSQRDMDRIRDRFKSGYPTIEQLQEIEFTLEGTKLSQRLVAAGFKMTDQGAVNVLMLKALSFGTVRLAPYEQWDQLSGTARLNWDVFTRVVGRKVVKRIGCRFINRIDIPNKMFNGRRLADLFRTRISLAMEIDGATGPFSFSINVIHRGTGAKLLIQSAVVHPPALLDHTSVTLDTDAYWDSDIPLRVEDMWSKADILRDAKNDVFENSITDDLRGLFQ